MMQDSRILSILRGAMLLLLLVVMILTSLSTSLRLSVFNTSFYQGIARTPEYTTMVTNAIRGDLAEQSRYVGIDFPTFSEALDDRMVAVQIESYYRNLAEVLKEGTTFQRIEYPQDEFYNKMMDFIDLHAKENGYTPSDEQYDLLRTVAQDSAAIAARHINLVDMNNASVKKVAGLFLPSARRIADSAVYLLILSILMIVGTALLYRGQWDSMARSIATSAWIAGVLIAVPAVVMEVFQFSSRISIRTMYVRYFIDRLLSSLNGTAMLIGLCLVGVSSVIKIALFVRRGGFRFFRSKHRKRTPRKYRIDPAFAVERSESDRKTDG
jgi:hypothetical protein